MNKELKFICKPVENPFFEWGRNCATLGFDKAKSWLCLMGLASVTEQEASIFWEGYKAGPRLDNTVISLAI